MANAINIPKSHLIMGLSLPLAVLLGYFVAEPMGLGSLAVVVFVLVVLAFPLMMRWYYACLLLTWNAAFCPAFLPGQPSLWALFAFAGLLFAIVRRSVSPEARFVVEPTITRSLLALTGVVVMTGLLTGGFGFRMLGGGQYGGKRYFYFLAAVAGYFVITSRRIPPHRAGLYLAMYFLSGLTYAVIDLGSLGGSKFDFLWLFFAPSTDLRQIAIEGPNSPFAHAARLSEFAPVGGAILGYILARFGIRGVFDLRRPWLLLLFLLAWMAGLSSGFRSFVLFSGMTFAIVFWLEGLHRTRYLAALLIALLVGSVVVLPQADKLPLMVQRALCFLPGKFDYRARESGASSVEWRLGIWREVWPEVPKHLFRGKGWGIDARDFVTAIDMGDPLNQQAGTLLAGDYHNGPLSVLIPFGLYGAIALAWFLFAGLRVLYRNWKFGDPALRNVNTLLLAVFAARAIWFWSFFGSLHSDMASLLGALGLSVALNGTEAASLARADQPAAGVDLNTEYVRV
jgi:O-antigen ligase